MSKLAIQLMIIGTILILWGILMLSIHYKHKKRMKEIDLVEFGIFKDQEDGN